MASSFQAASLVASPSYPNAVAWSDENLVAVASGHLVTILNPAMPFGPRGLISISPSKPFPIGVIERKDLLSGCLLPTCLSRDLRPLVRSISWSPIGFAPNSGCLLSVCTTEGRVKIYRMPYCEFSAEWVEVVDISETLYNYFSSINFGDPDNRFSEFSDEQVHQPVLDNECSGNLPISISRKECKRRKQNPLAVIDKNSGNLKDQYSSFRNYKDAYLSSTQPPGKLISVSKELALFPNSLLQEGSSVEVLRLDGDQRIWIEGILDRLNGAKALVVFPETDGNRQGDEWVVMDPRYDNTNDPKLLGSNVVHQEYCIPSIRPSMDAGNLPQEISLCYSRKVEEILKTGDVVEAWTNDRWVEGIFMGLNESGLLVKLHGDIGSVTLDASCVRLAPLWINEQNSWQVTLVKIEMKDQELCKVVEIKSDNMKANNLNQIVPVPNSKTKSTKKVPEKSTLPLITADQYASRSAMLSSLVVAWSPVLQLMSETGPVSPNYSSNFCSVLAVGGKSGKISFWRILEPECVSVMSNRDSTTAFLVGLLQAHSAWITAISWALFASNTSDPQLLLATGSSDGSVKIWLGDSRALLKCSEVDHTPFSLLKEVIIVDSVPVSIVSLIVPVQSPNKMHLAVGKGSGSIDVLICDISTVANKYDEISSYGAHDHIVTGLAWAFDGCCLYSCSQDNSVHSWILHDNVLCEVPFPSNTPGVKSSSDVPNVFDSCFGLAASPGNLVVAVARSFDADLLNPMYQARTQKAAVEFFWTGGQQLDILYNKDHEFDGEAYSGFPENELIYWEYNILWSLNQYEHVEKPLVVWDIISALLAFKQFAPKYIEHVIAKWLISWGGTQLGLNIEETLSQVPRLLSQISSHRLHLLNIISRRLFLAELQADNINCSQKNLGVCGAEQHLALWLELLLSSESELRGRLVAISLSSVLSLISHSSISGDCNPVGYALMEQWVELNHDYVQDNLKILMAEVSKLKKSRLHSVCKDAAEEQCSYCSASVLFESEEVAFCQGVSGRDGIGQIHKLFRCAASMQVCPITPSWFCMCCQRWVSKLAPQALFRMTTYPLDFKLFTESSRLEVLSKPLCPFCGILLQRLQPEFLLSTSPV
ncbi:Cytosolic iron-sulfur protein assembly protein [Actinidia chinensis var. chinensis]|uniref:Cytosolic iron-sulfur protein assembly protein n=1 Tax=Actinidia chinensis var. chinensis TaxID=1590841 RepID=A0A2R6RSE7_ACTCC|nr:Cytosolic iron-sulfur protein assembly protein [Actinidia chinensis var. chinensis]